MWEQTESGMTAQTTRRIPKHAEYLVDEGVEPSRTGSSAVRYSTAVGQAAPRSVMRVTDHRGQVPVRRASKPQPQIEDPYTPKLNRSSVPF